jgi:hypothetical protein
MSLHEEGYGSGGRIQTGEDKNEIKYIVKN